MTNERLAVSACDLDDLDLPALDAFLVERAPALLAATSREELGARLGLLSKGSPRVTPTLAGLYLFGKLPQHTFPEWGVGCFASTGTSLLDPVAARADLEGGVAALVAGCVAFVRGHAGEQASGDATEYSESLVREVVVNALVHRDLRKTSRVALRLFVDRLELWSPGGPPGGRDRPRGAGARWRHLPAPKPDRRVGRAQPRPRRAARARPAPRAPARRGAARSARRGPLDVEGRARRVAVALAPPPRRRAAVVAARRATITSAGCCASPARRCRRRCSSGLPGRRRRRRRSRAGWAARRPSPA
jgi:hypothetical protein